MSALTQTTMSDAVKTQYEKRLLARALPRLVFGRWGTKARLNKMGSYELRAYGSMPIVTSALTEGTTPGEQTQPSITLTTMTPAWYGAWIGYTDELEFTQFDPIVSEITSILGEQCGLSLDTLARNALLTGATTDYSQGVSARASLDAPQHNMDYSDLVKQIAYLEAANARPVEGSDFVLIIHPHTWATLMQDETFVNMFVHEPATSEGIRSGLLGRIMRTQIYVTSNMTEYADTGVSSTTDVYNSLFLGAEAFGTCGISPFAYDFNVDSAGTNEYTMTGKAVKPVSMIFKELGSAGSADPLNQRGTIGWKVNWALSVTNANWIRACEHTNAFSDE